MLETLTRSRLVTLLSIALSMGASFTSDVFPAWAARQPFVVGIVIDGPWERNDEILDTFRTETLGLTGGEFDVQFPATKALTADWTVSGVSSAIDALLADDDVDLILALGVLASHDVCRRGRLSKPALAPFVINLAVQEIPDVNGTSGVRNLAYIAFPADTRRDFEVFLDVVPFRRVALLHAQVILEALPQLKANVLRSLGDLDLDIDFIPVHASADDALRAIAPDVEAVYIAPLLALPTQEFDRLVAGLIERKLPSFSTIGSAEVKRGILAGTAPDFNIPPLARRIALFVQRILLGEQPSTFQVVFDRGERLTINDATARAIGVSPSWKVINEADLVAQEQREAPRKLTLDEAVREALEANRDLVAGLSTVRAGLDVVREARAILLPQAGVDITGALIDDDLGSAQQSERQLTASASLSQILFSDSALSNLRVQQDIQLSREQALSQLRLDVILATAQTYQKVLLAKTAERIQKDNLKVSVQNLELARVRESIGFSGPGEVYRWESRIATDRKRAIDANTLRNLAEIELNRLLNRPLEGAFQAEETGVDDPHLVPAKDRLLGYLRDRGAFRAFREFTVREGLAASPELAQLDAAIQAQKQLSRSASRAFWMPTVALQGGVDRIVTRSGAGSGGPAFGGDLSWNLGVRATLPLFAGGSRVSALRRSREDLDRLEVERSAAAQRIEQRIRSALHLMGASFAGIELSYDAADAASKNLELVTDAYRRGGISVLDLLDAQNAAVVAEQLAANSVYEFLLDFLEVERSAGRFTFLMLDGEVEAIYDRLDATWKQSTP